jgi:hypothetical protein
MALSYGHADKLKKTNEYAAFAQSSYVFLETGVAIIEQILRDELDIVNPFKAHLVAIT